MFYLEAKTHFFYQFLGELTVFCCFREIRATKFTQKHDDSKFYSKNTLLSRLSFVKVFFIINLLFLKLNVMKAALYRIENILN